MSAKDIFGKKEGVWRETITVSAIGLEDWVIKKQWNKTKRSRMDQIRTTKREDKKR